jgi:hypothetical protein
MGAAATDVVRARAASLRRAWMAAVLVAAIMAGERPAAAEPSDKEILWTGIGLALPMYAVGVSLHEGSHALAAKIVGASVDELHVFPPGIDPHTHTFRFGWTYVHGLKSDHAKEFFYIAPKITDTLFLGAFAAIVFTGAWPHNRWGELGLTVAATGFWVDFSKDVVLFSKNNDVVKVFDLWGLTSWKQIPTRIVYAGAVVGLGFVVARGYERMFDRSDGSSARVLILPVVNQAF